MARHEVLVVVRRPGPELLVLLRSPKKHGYWLPVAGGVEPDEEPAQAACRELGEEVGPGLAGVELEPIPLELGYEGADGPVVVHAFVADAPSGWEPVLNEEHVAYRWCRPEEADALVPYPEPRAALAWAARAGARS
ncbi:MAG TPA: NUDIX domain-containing protein [Gaiellaceae bacterium]|nr:NUDIX domain-containing protein [Gaiellaceae bacterium]